MNDALIGKMFLCSLGGALAVYGWIERGKTQPHPDVKDPLMKHLVQVPDPVARTNGNMALSIGCIFLLGAIFF